MNKEMTFLTKRQKVWGFLFVFPVYFYLAPRLSVFLLRLFNLTTASDMGVYYNLFIQLITFISMIFVLFKFYKDNIFDFLNDGFETIVWTLTIGLCIFYASNIIGGAIVSIFAPSNIEEASNQSLVIEYFKTNPGLMVLVTCVCAPIVEETLFRGIIFNSLRKVSVVPAHIISAFLFGMIHIIGGLLSGNLMELIYLFQYMLPGLSFSFAYEKRKTIIAPIMMHMVTNFVATALIIYGL